MNRKQLPLVVMLLAGGITAVALRIMNYELESFLWILLLVLIVFYIAGCVLKGFLDKFEAEEEEKRRAEEEAMESDGEVIRLEDGELPEQEGDGESQEGQSPTADDQ